LIASAISPPCCVSAPIRTGQVSS